MRYGVADAIGLYQRHLSPWKGFCCAHHALHARGSGSAFGKWLVMRSGVWRFLALMPLRFKACRKASVLLAVESETKSDKLSPSKSNSVDKAAFGCMAADLGSQAACCLFF
jgi:putative component of membrane protein insertase Oxa1/YidC/SpoIIIJ protein YidD